MIFNFDFILFFFLFLRYLFFLVTRFRFRFSWLLFLYGFVLSRSSTHNFLKFVCTSCEFCAFFFFVDSSDSRPGLSKREGKNVFLTLIAQITHQAHYHSQTLTNNIHFSEKRCFVHKRSVFFLGFMCMPHQISIRVSSFKIILIWGCMASFLYL